MIRWTGLAPWEFEFPLPGSLISTFLEEAYVRLGISRWLVAWIEVPEEAYANLPRQSSGGGKTLQNRAYARF